MATVSEALGIARQHHHEGRLEAAAQLYHQIVAAAPDNADAWHLLGIIGLQVGNFEIAVEHIRRAIALNDRDPAFHNNLGSALTAQGKLTEAIPCIGQALERDPGFAEAHYNLGTVNLTQGRLDDAIACFRRALQLNPNYADACNNLAVALQTQGKLEEALVSYHQTMALRPDNPNGHFNLGNAFRSLGKLDEAATCFRRALELNPNFAEAINNLGHVLHIQGKPNEAVSFYRRALELKPDYGEAYNNLGSVLQSLGQQHDAIACYRRAMQFKPDLPEAPNNLGNMLKAEGKFDEAIAAFCLAIELKSDYAEAYSNLGNVLKDRGDLQEAIAVYRRALALRPGLSVAHSNLLYTLYFCPGLDAATIYHEHRLWNRQHGEPLAQQIRPHSNDANPDRRLKIGYVSPNFRNHAESFFIAPLFAAHDHQQVEIFCYSDVVLPDVVTEKLHSNSDVWRTTNGLSDEQVAELIRADQIDILVDLTMHMAEGRPLLFARKPAPVQVCWLAYQGTTGLDTMDYRLTDPHLDPPGMFDRYYSEESVRLPDAFWCYDPLTDEPAESALPAREKGYLTFGCLNNFCKVTDDVLRLWARILRAVERSRLLLLTAEGLHRQRIIDLLGREGVAPERITFSPHLSRPDYLRLYHQVDLGLDTFPYNGQTTTLDAIWLGVPVVTIIGQTSAARAGASLLWNLGAPELVAESPDQFVSIAVELANDLERLSSYRASLRQQLKKSPLMDAPRFAGNVEAAYRAMWKRWCAAHDANESR